MLRPGRSAEEEVRTSTAKPWTWRGGTLGGSGRAIAGDVAFRLSTGERRVDEDGQPLMLELTVLLYVGGLGGSGIQSHSV